MLKQSLGIIETIGLAPGIVAADICLKSANVKLVGYELTRGSGMVVIKIEGDVSAVTSAVQAAKAELIKYKAIYSTKVIARPAEGIEFLTRNKDTVGYNLIVEEEVEQEEVRELVPEEDEKSDEVEKPEEDEKPGEEEPEDGKSDEEEPQEGDILKEDKDIRSEEIITCNLCHDPKCPRKKGDLRQNCIHFNDEK